MSEGRFNLSALAVRERAITVFLLLLISLAGADGEKWKNDGLRVGRSLLP